MPAKWKFKEVEDLVKKINQSPVIAIAGITSLPSKQMQEVRKKLKGEVEIKVVKNNLAKLAFEKSKKPGLKDLEKSIEGPVAIIFSKDNPFKLAQLFISSRVKAPAKTGQKAPFDIIVPAGDTPFKPGPIIGDLQQVGIKAKIQGPIIVVTQDSPVIKKGEKFSQKLASVLSQLEIHPMEIGINIQAALENAIVYTADVLSISKEKVLEDIILAHQNAINLAVEARIFNKESTPIMVERAARVAKELAIEAKVYTPEEIVQKFNK